MNAGAACTGDRGVFIGKGACPNATTSDDGIAIGHDAGSNVSTANDFVIIGESAVGSGVMTGGNNVVIGPQAGSVLTSGDSNVFLGRMAGNGVTTGAHNVLLGGEAGTGNSPSGNVTTQNGIFCLGDAEVTALYCMDTSISSSDARDKTDIEDFKYGLSWITELRPVTYRWDRRSWYTDDPNTKGTPDGSKKRARLNIGFLAQEAMEVEKKHGFAAKKDDMIIINQDEDVEDPSYGMKYERLVPVLVNAIKELKAENDELRSLIKDSKTFASLKSSINN